jgi:hypothetical protein
LRHTGLWLPITLFGRNISLNQHNYKKKKIPQKKKIRFCRINLTTF